MMEKFLICNFILLFGVVFVQCFDLFADEYKFSYAMASRCKEHVSSGQEYTTFYKVTQRFDAGVRFEMHLAILAPSDGHILLSSVEHPTQDDPVYEIAVGAGDNVFSELRKKISRQPRVAARTKGILSPINFRAFWIKVNDDGHITFGSEGVSMPTLSYQDPFPLPVRFFSFATWGNIQAKFLYDCPFGQNETDDLCPSRPPCPTQSYKQLHESPFQNNTTVTIVSSPSPPTIRSQLNQPLNQKNLTAPVPSPPSVPDNYNTTHSRELDKQLLNKYLSELFPFPPSVHDNSSQLNQPLNQKNLSAPVPSLPSVPDKSSQLNQNNLSAPVPSPPSIPDNSSQLNQNNLSAPVPSPPPVPDNSSQLSQKNLSAPVPSSPSVLDNSSQLNQALNQKILSAPVPSPPSVPDNSSQINQSLKQNNLSSSVPSPASVPDNSSQLNQKKLSAPVPSPSSMSGNSSQLNLPLNQKNLSAPVASPPSVPDNSRQINQPLNQKNLSAPVPSPPSVLDNSSQLNQPVNQKNLSAPVPSPPSVLDNSSKLNQTLNQKNLIAPVPSPPSVPDNSSQFYQSLNKKNLSAPVPSPPSVPDNSSQLNQILNQKGLSAPVPSPPSVPGNSKQPIDQIILRSSDAVSPSVVNKSKQPIDQIIPRSSDAVSPSVVNKNCYCPPHPPCPIQPDTHINQPIAEKFVWKGVTSPYTNYLPHPTPSQVKGSTPVFVPVSKLGLNNPYTDNNVRWVPSNKSKFRNLTGKALIAGHEDLDGIPQPLWIIRARHAGDLLPGKLVPRTASAFLPYSEKEISVDNFEVLCVNPSAVHWVPAAMGHIPPKAVPGGETVKGEKLYIGRVRHEGSLTPGKIHPKNKCLYIPYGRHEIAFRTYEVLVRV